MIQNYTAEVIRKWWRRMMPKVPRPQVCYILVCYFSNILVMVEFSTLNLAGEDYHQPRAAVRQPLHQGSLKLK